MNYPPEIDLVAMHEAIKNTLRVAFPIEGKGSIASIDYYMRDEEVITCPAIRFELNEITPGDQSGDIGTEQFEGLMHWAAYCVVPYSPKDQKSKLLVRCLATAIAAVVRGQRWGIPCSPAQIVEISSAGILPHPKGEYSLHKVEWTQSGLFGKSVWDNSGIIPNDVFFGYNPKIGVRHVRDYRDLNGQAPVVVVSLDSGNGILFDSGETVTF